MIWAIVAVLALAIVLIAVRWMLDQRKVHQPTVGPGGIAAAALRELSLSDFGESTQDGDQLVAIEIVGENCDSCATLRSRLDRTGGVVRVIELSAADERVTRHAKVEHVPTLLLFDAQGQPVRSFVGLPMVGVVERTIAQALR